MFAATTWLAASVNSGFTCVCVPIASVHPTHERTASVVVTDIRRDPGACAVGVRVGSGVITDACRARGTHRGLFIPQQEVIRMRKTRVSMVVTAVGVALAAVIAVTVPADAAESRP